MLASIGLKSDNIAETMDVAPDIKKLKLLLADDSVTIRKVVELTFAEEGIEVISAGDGDAAMQKFVQEAPDIVLVDVEMPGQSGYQICEMIKADESTRDIPVLLLVGSFEPFDQTEAERVQADGFLTKPFHSIRELVVKVRELLDEKADAQPVVPDADDIDELYNSSFAETVEVHEADAGEDLEATSFDDETVEELKPVGGFSENGFSDTISTAETVQANLSYFDWEKEPSAETEADPVDPAIHDPKADTEEVSSPFATRLASDHSSDLRSPLASDLQEPSEELITLIAKRVVEKLSDRVIRDIAQEAVPRITEKLIREALEEDGRA